MTRYFAGFFYAGISRKLIAFFDGRPDNAKKQSVVDHTLFSQEDIKKPETWKCYHEDNITSEPCGKCDIVPGDGIWECMTCGYGVANLENRENLLSQREIAEQAGLSRHQKVTAGRLANIPEADFNHQIESDQVPTLTQLSEQGKISNSERFKFLTIPYSFWLVNH